MSDPVFFARKGPFRIADIAEWTGAALPDTADPGLEIHGIAPLDRAGPNDLSSMHNSIYMDAFKSTRAGAVLAAEKFAGQAPASTLVLTVAEPQRAMALVAARLYPESVTPRATLSGETGVADGAHVHADARLEDGVTVETGAAVGAGAEIGSGTVICSNAVIGGNVRIGRDCMIGPGASVMHALIGNRVALHSGVRVGQDGFGYAGGPEGHAKIPQVGRAIIQDDVEIGANSCVDRGAIRDTVIGEGTKIDNLVQIGHNVTVGRHCIIVALTGISGSVTIGDFAVIGGQVGMLGHITIGAGAQIASQSGVVSDVPPGERWGGAPARPMRDFAREIAAVKRLAQAGRGTKKNG